MKQLIFILFACCFIYTANGQAYPALEKVLTAKFSETSTKDGRWIFNSGKANIEKIDKPLVNAVIPNYTFYKITLTNYSGDHINEENCVVLYDSSASKIVLVEPLWYSGISKPFITLFLRKHFDSREQLSAFLEQLNELMELGSGCKFIRTGFSDSLATYDVVNFNEGSGGNKEKPWKQIRIDLEDRQVVRYTSINPANRKKEIIK